MLKQVSLNSPKFTKIALRLTQTQVAIWPASNFFSIVLILAIVFPETHGANFVMAPTEESLKLATRTTIALVVLNWFVYVLEHFEYLRIKPTAKTKIHKLIFKLPNCKLQSLLLDRHQPFAMIVILNTAFIRITRAGRLLQSRQAFDVQRRRGHILCS